VLVRGALLYEHGRVNLRHFLCALLAWLGSIVFACPAATPHIHTSRISPKILPLPKGDDVFHFIVFGDRTGGPAEGIKVLAQAVEDSNLLDPDLVMTVGDLVNGYNQTGPWMKQMEEYQSTMSKLNMPWFPVAGNHDIYWRRDARNPEAKPPRENEESYEKHFGPLWYWFEHKNTGFLVLFSDEGHPDGRQRDFGDREQQQISRTQLNWIAAELEKMKRLKHVFVFLHHPYWWGERYQGSNWDEVHKLLVKNGNVRAVLAGHIHQMRYDGVRDGIAYYALATTGGSLPAGIQHQYFGLLHHFNVVTVRDSGFTMASVPVGSVFDPKQFTPERMQEVEAARYTLHQFISPPIAVNQDGSASAIVRVALTNPCSLPIEITLLAKGDPAWLIAPDHRHAKIDPKQGKVFEFACAREATKSLEDFTAPEFELRFDVLAPGARLAMPAWSLRAATRLLPPGSGWPEAKTNHALVLNGTNACLEIDQSQLAGIEGPFTVEAWVLPSRDTNGAIVSNLKIGGFSLEVAGPPQFRVQTDSPEVNERRFTDLKTPIAVKSRERLAPGRWTHLAGVFNGQTIALFVDGKKVASTNAAGARLSSDKSLYIGARPNGAFNTHNFSYPMLYYRGSVDDVRISRAARYERDFTPPIRLARDRSTVFVLANDEQFGPFVPADAESPAPVQALIKGQPRFAPAER
jgi:3',5'-cyclic AMP phosphodiesterase CpdA